MFLLYADESGASGDAKQEHLVLAGICVFERQGYWLSEKLVEIARRFNPADPQSVELHGSPMLTGKGMWRKVPIADRIKAIKDALELIKRQGGVQNPRLFACVVNKQRISPKDPVTTAFEQLVTRFDFYLMRRYKAGDPQRGILIFDESTYENTLQQLATDFREYGHKWGVLKNLAEVPLFIDSRASRLIQLADLVAYAIFRKFESGDDQFYKIIAEDFDRHEGIMHGLCTL